MDFTTGAASDRCPRCAALVRPGSQWCTLCYADLRPAPPREPVPEPEPTSSVESVAPPRATAQPVPVAASSELLDPLTAPLALLEARVDAPAREAAAEPTTTQPVWPCARCGATVPLNEPNCTSCGAGFLEGTLPADAVLGRLSNGSSGPVSNQTKLFIMIGGSLGLLVLMLGAMYILGTIF
ncbi:MAG TPA: hypothetical protein VFN80_01925 [Acidothermaceae bacterium]|nr:hypothetical protein [Acidothermaceae bacterium]